MLVHGDIDEVLPAEHLYSAGKALENMRVPVTACLIENLGHSISLEALELAQDFLQNILDKNDGQES